VLKKNFSFLRTQRVRKKKEFDQIFQSRQKLENAYVKLFYAENHCTKIAVVAGKRVGNAVVRNQYKRRIREYFRTTQHEIKANTAMIVVAKPDITKTDYAMLADSLNKLLSRRNLIQL